MVTWSTSSDMDPYSEATFQCGFGISDVHTNESETKKKEPERTKKAI